MRRKKDEMYMAPSVHGSPPSPLSLYIGIEGARSILLRGSCPLRSVRRDMQGLKVIGRESSTRMHRRRPGSTHMGSTLAVPWERAALCIARSSITRFRNSGRLHMPGQSLCVGACSGPRPWGLKTQPTVKGLSRGVGCGQCSCMLSSNRADWRNADRL